MKPEDITIIIPHLGETAQQCYALRECRKSLEENSPKDMKRLVIRNGPYNCYCETDVQIKDQGQCKAVNVAAAMVNTPFLLISNDDMIYPPHWFEHMQRGENADVFPICLSPKLVEPRPGAPTFAVFFAGGAGGDFDAKKFYKYVGDQTWDAPNAFRKGFNMPLLIYKKLWDTIAGYDINYDPWGSNSDSDLEYKIKLAGIQPLQNPNWLVYHFSQTSGTFEPRNDAARFRNYAYFKEKWGFERTDNGIWEASFLIPGKDEGRIYFPEWEGKYGSGL